MVWFHRVRSVFQWLINTADENFSVGDYQWKLIAFSHQDDKPVSVEVSICQENKPEIRLHIGANGSIFGHIVDGSEDPQHLYEKTAIKYIDCMIENGKFEDRSAFAEAITVREMSSIPPGANPYHYDSVRMGCDIGQNWQSMFYTAQSSEEDPKPSLNELVLINTKTGRRFHLDLTKANEPILVEEKTKNNFKIGTRIRFTKDIIDPACGDHPTLLYARQGAIGSIIHNEPHRDFILARTDTSEDDFRVFPTEFEVIENAVI